MDPRSHWERQYTTKGSAEFSWYQAEPARALALLRDAGAGPASAVIDVGGGDSTLVDCVLRAGLGRVTVLDISSAALARAKSRLGARARQVEWIEADITRAPLARGSFDVWHDRATFHFLLSPEERARYVESCASALRAGGTLIVATFAPDGPPRCSGLDVARYDADALAHEFGDRFTLQSSSTDTHHTPAGATQRFTVAALRRR